MKNIPFKSLEERFNTRDQQAYSLIYEKYWALLLDTAFKRVRDIHIAEDLTQEVFISLFVQRNTLIINGSLENYLQGALRYRILTSFRFTQIHNKYLRSLPNPSDPIHSDDPETLLQVKELQAKIKQAISELPDRPRQAFILSKLHQQSNKEIAVEMGISVSTVEKHLGKARKMLEKKLGKVLFTFLISFIFIFFDNP